MLAGGSYYLETITDLLAREGWKLMQEIEARGGYRKAQADGDDCRGCSSNRSAARENGRCAGVARVFVGTNQFANPAEQALERADRSERMSAETARGTLAL